MHLLETSTLVEVECSILGCMHFSFTQFYPWLSETSGPVCGPTSSICWNAHSPTLIRTSDLVIWARLLDIVVPLSFLSLFTSGLFLCMNGRTCANVPEKAPSPCLSPPHPPNCENLRWKLLALSLPPAWEWEEQAPGVCVECQDHNQGPHRFPAPLSLA